MKDFSFNSFKKISKPYINNEKYKIGHAIILTGSNVLISAPHGVPQTRLGKLKLKEVGSARIALVLQELLNANLIIKTKNMFDDANYDVNCPYRKDLRKIISNNNIKYLLDIHCLASYRKCDVNLGVNISENIKNNIPLFDKLEKELTTAGLVVSIDSPFAGKYPTISGDMHQKFNIWTIQIEVNCSITNEIENFDKLKKLLNAIVTTFSNV